MGAENIAAITAKMAGIMEENTDLKQAIHEAQHIERPAGEGDEFYRGWDAALRSVAHIFSELT